MSRTKLGYLSDSLAADLPTGTDHYVKYARLLPRSLNIALKLMSRGNSKPRSDWQWNLRIGFEADIDPIEVSNGDHGLSSMEDALLLLSLGIVSLGTVSLFPAAKVSSGRN
jgi:hypothetical protein